MSKPKPGAPKKPKKPIEPLSEKTLAGIRRQAFHYLQDPRDVEEIVNDVYHAYLAGDVPKELLLRAMKLRAINRYRYNEVRRTDVNNLTHGAVVRRTAAPGEASDEWPSGIDEATGELEEKVTTFMVAPSVSLDPVDPAIDAMAGLMVEGPHRRVPIGIGHRTIANYKRNEDRVIARIAARQLRARGQISAEASAAIGKLARSPAPGRPNEKDRRAAEQALRGVGLVGGDRHQRGSA